MTQPEVEALAHRYARAVVRGDVGTIVRTMTPDAFAKLMEMSGREFFQYYGYDLSVERHADEQATWTVSYQTELGTLTMRYYVRPVDGTWKIVDLEQAGGTASPPGAGVL